MKTYRSSGGITLLLNLELDGDEWSASCPGYFTPAKESLLPMNRRLGESQNRSKCFGKDINLLPLLGFEPWFIQPVA